VLNNVKNVYPVNREGLRRMHGSTYNKVIRGSKQWAIQASRLEEKIKSHNLA
jgi:hypothetical protein